ncbi:MAG: NADH-ubiquinone oxidoreductase-F iron-sulfur binding region domain-containing protein [candidate division Zixibacteria bacterium]|nr:NADH-ubiquinone oxidoreductase-F iron-sulfur binding region domain-containing protein [candidate division Zixibacteria bacterium]
MEDVCGNIIGHTVCPLGDAAVMPIQSAIRHWRDEWQYHIDNKKCLVKSEFAFK